MEAAELIIFAFVYLGMVLGTWPGLALDRTGIALLGAIAFIELRDISIAQATSYVDLSALSMLFSFMIISAQFYYSGFYTYIVELMDRWKLTPSYFLAAVLVMAALLSALLINDIVCLALTPLIIKICLRKQLNPVPFLIGLACASNIGSALTLVGNPQNLLIGQVLHISFLQYLKFAWIPCLLSLAVTWGIIYYQTKGKWEGKSREINPETIPFDSWQSAKGVMAIILLLAIFLFTDLPRDQISLAVAGCLLLSRQMASQTMLSFIDWQLLILFIGLFIVNRSFLSANVVASIPHFLESYNLHLEKPSFLMLISLVLSNIVSNVPAVMLILPFIKTNLGGSLLALSSTLAGNLFIVGSIANLIVISQAAKFDIKIDWKMHMRIGFPVTLISFIIMAIWIFFTSS
jgi:Na+/H+ antiporter NhaD/arsenite permease-like protein